LKANINVVELFTEMPTIVKKCLHF